MAAAPEPVGTRAVRPSGTDAEPTGRRDGHEEVRRLASLLDSQFRIPGTQLRFGLDALIGLIPGIGDVAGLVLSTGLVVQAVRLGARGATVVRMVLYVVLDATIGAIPVLGSVFDFFFKANIRAVNLLADHAEDPERTREESGPAVWRTILGVVGAALLIGLLLLGAAVGLLVVLVSAIF